MSPGPVAGRPARVVRSVRDGARTQLWPIPTLGVLAALALGIALPRIDAAYATQLPDQTPYLFTGGADSARSVLEAVSRASSAWCSSWRT